MEIEFDEYELKSKISEYSEVIKGLIRRFFENIEIQILLDNNKFEHIYSLFKNL